MEITITVQTWSAPVRERKGAPSQIKQLLQRAGYPLVFEDAKQRFWENFPLVKVENTNVSRELGVYRDMMTSRHTRVAPALTFVPLRSGKGFVITSLEVLDPNNVVLKVTALSIGSCDEELAEILTALSELIPENSDGQRAAWTEERHVSHSASEAPTDYLCPSYTIEDCSLAELVSQSAVRKALQTVKGTGVGMLMRDFERKFPDSSQFLRDCISHGLLTSEFLVMCKQNSEQLNRVPNREVIEIMADNGVRCPRCSRSVRDELVEEVLSATDRCKALLDQSEWMTIRLVQELVRRGVEPSAISVNVTDGPDEIDAFVTVAGKQFMFELKDSQFSMRHAYAFGSRVAINRPHAGVIWAIDGVAPEVKSHFERLKPASPIKYVESLADLPSALDDLLQAVHWELAEQAVQSLSGMGLVVYDLPAAMLQTLRQVMATESSVGQQAAATEE